ncbi:MAG: cation:proton antiporter [Actinomycetes bacterium]
MEALVIATLALLAIAASTQLGPRVGLATPLILVALGWLASLPSFVPDVEVDPEWILAGILPPLLYGAAVSMPTTEFRREFRQISGLSVALVAMTTLGMGFFLHWLIPDLALPWAFALGAILSPTDPVAIGIVKKLGISPRVVALLEGESLLNDATALVLLRTAVGAAVVAGLITGASDVRHLSPQHRISDHQNWRTVELVLEGAVYLIMGLELTAVIHDVQENASHSIGGAVGYAALALVACLVLRAGYTVPLLAGMRRAAARARRVAPRITEVRNRIESGDAVIIAGGPRGMFGAMRHALEPDREAIRRRIRRYENDIDYMLRQNLGWREGPWLCGQACEVSRPSPRRGSCTSRRSARRCCSCRRSAHSRRPRWKSVCTRSTSSSCTSSRRHADEACAVCAVRLHISPGQRAQTFASD